MIKQIEDQILEQERKHEDTGMQEVKRIEKKAKESLYSKMSQDAKVTDALERGCTFENGIAIDDMGNEYRDENGQCVLLTK